MIDAFFDDVQNGLRGLCGTKWTKNSATMKNRRTEKTVRRNFINMGNTSKIAVKQHKQRKKAPIFSVLFLAGAEGLDPSARGFGDRCSTN